MLSFLHLKTGSPLDSAPWTTEEQKLLEQALKTYPVNTPERWEKIAAAVPGRSKKDCMKRYKVRSLTCSWDCHYPGLERILCSETVSDTSKIMEPYGKLFIFCNSTPKEQ